MVGSCASVLSRWPLAVEPLARDTLFEQPRDVIGVHRVQQALLEHLVDVVEAAGAQLVDRRGDVVGGVAKLDLGPEQRPERAGPALIGHADTAGVDEAPAVCAAIEQAVAKDKALAGDFDGLFRGALKLIR